MASSKHLRVQDIRAIVAIVGECRDLGDDPVVWRRHFVRCAAELVGAGAGNCAEWHPTLKRGGKHQLIDIDAGTRHEMIGIVDWGWHNGFGKKEYDELLRVFALRGASVNPMFLPYLSALTEDNGVSKTRADLVPDSEWYRSSYYRDNQSPVGVDALMYCHYYAPLNKENRYHEFTLARAIGEPDFSARDRTIIRELHSTIASLIGGSLAAFSDPAPSRLTPRQRQVLAALLQGDSDKQIAKRLGMTPSTAHQHVNAIFDFFTVDSRPELLARWVRRGWGRRFGWTEG